MASSIPSCCFYCHSASTLPNNNPTSTTHFALSFSHSIFNGYNGISLKKTCSSSRTYAKFDKFQGDPPQDSLGETSPSSSQAQPLTVQEEEEDDDDDSCLPSDLEGAVRQSGQASALFVSSGGMRAIVELLIPQLQFLDDEGAQAELWELSRVFVDTLIEGTGCQRVKAIFPDAGAAALLKYRWKDAAFGFSSLSDRKPVESEDEIVVMIVPDYQMLEYVKKIASDLSDDPPRPLIMWNPRLVSEDVGVGINVRNLRRYFLSLTKPYPNPHGLVRQIFQSHYLGSPKLFKPYVKGLELEPLYIFCGAALGLAVHGQFLSAKTFTTVYSMRPLPTGAVFRCYPGLWKVFYDDKDRPNRYLLAKELISRPDTEELELIFGNVEENSEQGPSLFDQAAGIFSSLNRFMRAISK